ncbi:hypothetical protein [Sphingobacterium kitahiroshimense]|uniref:Bacterial toxin 23 domain-containing protein n=1 Tax=Sphingobacterium kitahiroshimense TaxID=470446 RepID=A0ABV0BTZ4_9SPHI
MGYAWNARNNKKYDFKSKDIDDKKSSDQSQIQYYYRGSKTRDGEYGSARDFGNFGAGLVIARSSVLNWKSGRLGFDTYQGFKSNGVTLLGTKYTIPTPVVIPVTETTGTVKAQMRGYIYGVQKYK